MTDLLRLKVSLTKHNAHKIARLLQDYESDQILQRLNEVHVEKVQGTKILSATAGNVPEVWAEAKRLGEKAINALVLVGIIFSHHRLISATIDANARSGSSARIQRRVQLGGKSYTNFVRVLDQLGFKIRADRLGVTFSLRAMFETPGLGVVSKRAAWLQARCSGLEPRWDHSR